MRLRCCFVVGESLEELNGYGTIKSKNLISSILGGTPGRIKSLAISNPHDFRQVSAIIDVDIVPETCRRVRLLKHGSDKPLGFYIRDGTSVRVTQNGMYTRHYHQFARLPQLNLLSFQVLRKYRAFSYPAWSLAGWPNPLACWRSTTRFSK